MTLLKEAMKLEDTSTRRGDEVKASVEERIELGIAVIRGEVSMAQARNALIDRGYVGTGAEGILAGAIFSALRRGELRISWSPQ